MSQTCSGFDVSPKCEWRYSEMELVTYTPNECNIYP